MTAYRGFEVLEVEPNWRDLIETGHRDSWIKLDPGFGKAITEDRSALPAMDHAFSWFMESRSAIAEFKTFVMARKGAAVPFWFPTWRRDMQLVSDAASIDTGFSIPNVGYSKFLFPKLSRRYIAILFPNGTKVYRKVTNAQESVDGLTEAITLDAAIGTATPASTVVSSLLLCRLADDAVTVKWHNKSVAEAVLNFREIPHEATV